MSNRQKLGNRVRTLRIQQGWSQEKLGTMSGIHRTYISEIERGKTNLSFEHIIALSKALGVDLHVLLNFTGENKP